MAISLCYMSKNYAKHKNTIGCFKCLEVLIRCGGIQKSVSIPALFKQSGVSTSLDVIKFVAVFLFTRFPHLFKISKK